MIIGNRYYIRDRCRVEFRRCFAPTEPTHLHVVAPPLDDEAIQSGMLIVLDSGLHNDQVVSRGWRKAQADDTWREVYIALHDQADHDVQASENLAAWPVRSPAELDTGWFLLEDSEAFTLGAALTAGADGQLVLADPEGNAVVVAKVAAVGNLANGAFLSSGRTPAVHVEETAVVRIITGVVGTANRNEDYYLPPGPGSPYLGPDGNPYSPPA